MSFGHRFFHNVQIIYYISKNSGDSEKFSENFPGETHGHRFSQWIEVEEANDASHELLGALDP